MNIDEGTLLYGEIAAVHFELILEGIVIFKLSNFFFGRGCECEGE